MSLKDLNDISDMIAEKMGEASMAWEEVPSGIFDSEKVSDLHEEVMKEINIIVMKKDADLAEQASLLMGRDSQVRALKDKIARLSTTIELMYSKVTMARQFVDGGDAGKIEDYLDVTFDIYNDHHETEKQGGRVTPIIQTEQ